MYELNNIIGKFKSADLNYQRFKQIIGNLIRKNYYTRLIFGFDSRNVRNGLAVFVIRENALEVGIWVINRPV